VSLPQVVSIRLPPANMALKISLGNVQLNQLSADPGQLWTMPSFDGAPKYDLGGAPAGTPLPGQAATHPLMNGSVMPASYPAYPATSYPVTPAAMPPTQQPAAVSSAALPIYGQRSSLPAQNRRY